MTYIMLQGLSSAVVDCQENVERHFSLSELRELYSLKLETLSETHEKYVSYFVMFL